ncbi:acyl carrier protein [Streptomyces sp. NPDC087300]|uniref:acyl carrier protein n=1 Tax=Streptomyces sp. NPDC087300 TaxID=3365780 RepID=UPI00380EB813
MHLRTRAARFTAAAALTLTTFALGAPAAHASTPAHGPAADGDSAAARTAVDDPTSPYKVALSSSAATTDFAHRTTDLAGTVTRADGTPVTDAPVHLSKTVLYKTWNPWGDPIDPTERETLDLGTVRTDAQGRFTLAGVRADRWLGENSVYVFPRHQVQFEASYDPGPPDDNEIYFGDDTLTVQPVASSLTYKVNRTKVRAGDTLVVTGKVTWPAGHGPVAGTRVLLRTYFESAYDAQATTDAQGNFEVRAKIRDYDNEFVVFSAPKDYYIAGASKVLPVKNVS